MKNQFHPKYQQKYFWNSALKLFVASWKLFGLPWDLVSNIINKEGYWKPKKLPGSPQEAAKNFRAEILKYFLLVFWMKQIFHKDILNLTDLQRQSKINFLYRSPYLRTPSLPVYENAITQSFPQNVETPPPTYNEITPNFPHWM